MSCRKCCGCNGCGCNGCGCNGCGNNPRLGCQCLTNDVQKAITTLMDDVKGLQTAFNKLNESGCIKTEPANNTNNGGCNNNCGCCNQGCCGCNQGCCCRRC